MNYTRPKPRPPKATPGYEALAEEDRARMAAQAQYVGSPHHTDVPKYKIEAHPRPGAIQIDKAEDSRLKNPTCTLCPRKWVRKQEAATALLRSAIREGYFEATDELRMPEKVWVRDPEIEGLVYEAKLCDRPYGYKAYPLTSFQARFGLSIELP